VVQFHESLQDGFQKSWRLSSLKEGKQNRFDQVFIPGKNNKQSVGMKFSTAGKDLPYGRPKA
jgi:hypothetical protein